MRPNFSGFEHREPMDAGLRLVSPAVTRAHWSVFWPWKSRLEPWQTKLPAEWGRQGRGRGLPIAGAGGSRRGGAGEEHRAACRCGTNLLHIAWFKTIQIYFPMVSWSEIYNRGVGRAECLLEASGENASPCLF